MIGLKKTKTRFLYLSFFPACAQQLVFGNRKRNGFLVSTTVRPRCSRRSLSGRQSSNWAQETGSTSSKKNHRNGGGTGTWWLLSRSIQMFYSLGIGQNSAKKNLRQVASREQDAEEKTRGGHSRKRGQGEKERSPTEKTPWRHCRERTSHSFAARSCPSCHELMLAWPKIEINPDELLRLF